MSKYEVTESVANHVFTEGGFQKREVLLTQSVMFIFCTSLKTSAISKGAVNLRIYLSLTKSQELVTSAEYDHAHCRQTNHNKKLKMHGLSTSGYHMISALRGIRPMHISLETGMLVRDKSTTG